MSTIAESSDVMSPSMPRILSSLSTSPYYCLSFTQLFLNIFNKRDQAFQTARQVSPKY